MSIIHKIHLEINTILLGGHKLWSHLKTPLKEIYVAFSYIEIKTTAGILFLAMK